MRKNPDKFDRMAERLWWHLTDPHTSKDLDEKRIAAALRRMNKSAGRREYNRGFDDGLERRERNQP